MLSQDKTILITGGCGFVGSNIAIYFKNKYPGYRIISIDNLKRRGSEINVQRLKSAGIEFIHGDIRNDEDFNGISGVSVLIEAAAEPSVLSGISTSPDYVINTNLIGTLNCLKFAKSQNADVVFLSTSRVYPISMLNLLDYSEGEGRFVLSETQRINGVSSKGISETFPLSGARSFYGSSKLSSEMFIEEYVEFYGLRAIINRCGVITGPWQMGKIDQGVIVLWLAKHFWKKELSYIGFGGSGKQVRDILHIYDLFNLLDSQIHNFNLFNGSIFNVGGGLNNSVSLKELTEYCREITGNTIKINSVKKNRTADIPVYITDNSKIQHVKGWHPEYNIKVTLQDIFDWLKTNESILKTYLT